ncbi:MAG: restriction endonuclease subunit S [Kiritimatiellae bacterium]|nr:restriction endonuclease subunit S [Kiritimatiellia bacterium]
MSAASQRKMKPSGVDWIGDVPEGWGIDKFCYRFDFAKGLNITKQDLTETGVPVVSYGQIHSKRNNGVHLTDELLRHIPAELTKGEYAARLKRNDFVFADTSEDVEGIGNCVTVNRDEVIYAGYHTLVARPIEKVNCGYFGYLFKSECWRQQLRRKANSVKVYSISQRLFKGVSILLPPLDEQKRIAAKLDRLCGRVDELAENIKGEIAALQEYRKSLIIECVTKGLNPKAKMKPSGVDWIGDIPETRTLMRLRYLVSITTGDHDTQDADDTGEYPLYVRSPIVERSQRYTFEGPGVLMAGDGAGAGRIFHLVDGKYAVHQRVYRLYNFSEINQKFLWLWLQSFFPIIMDHGSAQSTVPSVRLPMLKNLIVALPTMNEQREIAAFLDKRCAVIDAKIAERQRQLEKLGEYRSSVIYEYVTGKKEASA